MIEIGRSQRLTDSLDPARAAALHQTLGLDGPPPTDVLPPFWHQIYFWDPHPPEALGPDSHPRVGQGVIPDLGLPRRMWAGGALEFLAPLRLGAPAEKVSTLTDVQRKEGRSGALGFVTLTHEIKQGGEVCVRERQDLVYRDFSPAARALPQARSDAHVKRRVTFDPTLLFRYSALTFNGHRIHYDADYARDIEGYAGLVVHGPLLAQLLIHLAVEQMGSLKSFAFRATAPLMDFEPAELCWVDSGEMWVRGPDGQQCMTADAI